MSDNKKTESATGQFQLIEATLTCLATHGLANTTVRTIAIEAGVSAGLVRHHFGSKDRLLAASYRRMNANWLERVARSVDLDEANTEQKLRQALKAYFPQDAHDIRRMKIIVSYWGMVPNNSEISAIQTESYSAFHALFSKLVTPLSASITDAEDITTGLLGLADGLWLECCLNPNRLTHEQAIKITWAFVQSRLSFAG